MNCPDCPLGPDRPCRGEPWHIERFCQIQPEYADIVRELAAGSGPGPTLAEKANNLARSLWDWAVSGFEMAGEGAGRRLEICRACEHFEAGRCKLCSCFMAAKVKLGTSACPIGKWSAVTRG